MQFTAVACGILWMQFLVGVFLFNLLLSKLNRMVCGERGDGCFVTIRTGESHNEHIGRNLLNTFYCYTF